MLNLAFMIVICPIKVHIFVVVLEEELNDVRVD